MTTLLKSWRQFFCVAVPEHSVDVGLLLHAPRDLSHTNLLWRREVMAKKPKYAKPPERQKSLKRKREAEDVDSLNERVEALDAGVAVEAFTDLPLSEATQNGLSKSHFKTCTTIQSRTIPSALKSNDILGAAKTGSGKTLAFVLPVLENLYRQKWTEYDGLGALILSPTRELAIQIFEVLRKVGRYHTFSAGLVIGGKDLQDERERLGKMNILVATPGRMQQHLDQASELDVGNLQMLVLDEADRIMDMGFTQTIDAIIDHLPSERQTLMFSATQTKRISDLARLSLTEPQFVSVHEGADSATPTGLQQNYVVTPLSEKLDTLWSFLKANVKKKIIVFLSSGKQVRFVYEAFRHLQPGLPLLHIHGRQKQAARLDITSRFSSSQACCLFATDVAARGLDFPSVDWVVQVDCPEDADTYIHRVGRTARYEKNGNAVLFVDPSEEEGMLNALERKRVTLEKINVRQNKMQNTIRSQLQNMCFKDSELKYLGQKAFVSYVRSVYIQKDRKIFDVKKLDLEDYASSLGLPGAPRVKFVKGEDAKKTKNMPRQMARMDHLDEDNLESTEKQNTVRTKYDRMFERQNQDVLAGHYQQLIEEDAEPIADGDNTGIQDDSGFMSVKRRFEAGDEALGASSESDEKSEADKENDTRPQKIQLGPKADDALTVDSKRREKLLSSKKKLLKFKGHGSHLHFESDNDEPTEKHYYQDEETFAEEGLPEEQRQKFLDEERSKAKQRDLVDKEVARSKRQAKKEKRKVRDRAEGQDFGGDDNDEDDGLDVQLEGGEEFVMPDLGSASESESEAEPAPNEKRKKKWFEDASSQDEGDSVGSGRQQKRRKMPKVDDPQTLEDLEAMATGLLAK